MNSTPAPRARPGSRPRSYRLESPILEREAYRLLQIIHSSRSLHRLRQETGRLGLLPGHEETEAARILTLAVIVRNNLDSSPLLPGDETGVLAECLTAWQEGSQEPFPRSLREHWPHYYEAGAELEVLGVGRPATS